MKEAVRSAITGLVLFIFNAIHAQPGYHDPFFNMNDAGYGTGDGANDRIGCMALRQDGKIFIGGNFTTYNGTSAGKIALLNPDGSVSNGFSTSGFYPGPVNDLAELPNGYVVAGGNFWALGGTTQNNVAYITPNGSVALDMGTGAGADFPVHRVVRDIYGSTLITGFFNTVNGVPRSKIARLHASGESGYLVQPRVRAERLRQVHHPTARRKDTHWRVIHQLQRHRA